MQITHYGHSAVFLEVADRRLLIDPGCFSDDWRGLTDLDAILVTHHHIDHVDPEHIGALIAANPGASVIVEPSVPDIVDLPSARLLAADGHAELGGVTIAAVGGTHAMIHQDIPMIGNVGLVISAEGEPTLFHPGDSLAAIPRGVDVVAVPTYGPWAAMRETIDFVRAVEAPLGFPIHDRLLSEIGHQFMVARLNEMTGTRMTDLRDGVPWTPQG